MDEYDWLDEQLQQDGIAAEEELLVEEILREGKRTKLRYGCPYCRYVASYFHQITIHMMKSKQCRESAQVDPCYPICLDWEK